MILIVSSRCIPYHKDDNIDQSDCHSSHQYEKPPPTSEPTEEVRASAYEEDHFRRECTDSSLKPVLEGFAESA